MGKMMINLINHHFGRATNRHFHVENDDQTNGFCGTPFFLEFPTDFYKQVST